MTFGLKAAADGLSGTLQVGGVDKATLDSSGKLTATSFSGQGRGLITSGTAQATTSGTSIDFTTIPSWVRRIVLVLSGVSLSGTALLMMQLGDSGGVENTGYSGGVVRSATGSATANNSAGFTLVPDTSASQVHAGTVILHLLDAATNTWVANSMVALGSSLGISSGGGAKSLSATLDRIRLTSSNGTDTFDAGSVNILYE